MTCFLTPSAQWMHWASSVVLLINFLCYEHQQTLFIAGLFISIVPPLLLPPPSSMCVYLPKICSLDFLKIWMLLTFILTTISSIFQFFFSYRSFSVNIRHEWPGTWGALCRVTQDTFTFCQRWLCLPVHDDNLCHITFQPFHFDILFHSILSGAVFVVCQET